MSLQRYLSWPMLLLAISSCCISAQEQHLDLHLYFRAEGKSPIFLAAYEAWFGHTKHIAGRASSHDTNEITKQILAAKNMGISAFVVDWYGYREPFIDTSYRIMQQLASTNEFQIAMMYDETDAESGATEQTIADLNMFHDRYLVSSAPGYSAYLKLNNRPIVFIFPKGNHTDWSSVRSAVNRWDAPPLLIYENLPGHYAESFDGFYAWINPGIKGWTADGSNWGEQYLSDFYQTMQLKYRNKIIVGGAWAFFDDSLASWGQGRHIAGRCGQTFTDTLDLWRKYFASGNLLPYIMIETWNDHEEGTAIEDGIPNCSNAVVPHLLRSPLKHHISSELALSAYIVQKNIGLMARL